MCYLFLGINLNNGWLFWWQYKSLNERNQLKTLSKDFLTMKVKCPTCKTKTEWNGNKFKPFCSERCRLLDLGKWLDEQYTIECDEVDPFEIQNYPIVH